MIPETGTSALDGDPHVLGDKRPGGSVENVFQLQKEVKYCQVETLNVTNKIDIECLSRATYEHMCFIRKSPVRFEDVRVQARAR